jgi:hypothetical protein
LNNNIAIIAIHGIFKIANLSDQFFDTLQGTPPFNFTNYNTFLTTDAGSKCLNISIGLKITRTSKEHFNSIHKWNYNSIVFLQFKQISGSTYPQKWEKPWRYQESSPLGSVRVVRSNPSGRAQGGRFYIKKRRTRWDNWFVHVTMATFGDGEIHPKIFFVGIFCTDVGSHKME